MKFLHELDADFADLVDIVAADRGLRRSLVEKDYWVTHTLWALQRPGFQMWFKGGTSLSKGFGLIERFSEDLDLKISPGASALLPSVTSWTRESATAVAERAAYFRALGSQLTVPGCHVVLEETAGDARWRSACLYVRYPARLAHDLPPDVSDHVLLEVGSARVTPHVSRDITAWVHQRADEAGFGDAFVDNRALGVRCVHPLVTLLEKCDALHRRFSREDTPPATFVRHYEDAAWLVRRASHLPPLPDAGSIRELAVQMVELRQLANVPSVDTPAFHPRQDARWAAVEQAHQAIAPMFWGPRISLVDACTTIRSWIAEALG
jgi:hypothetical protein